MFYYLTSFISYFALNISTLAHRKGVFMLLINTKMKKFCPRSLSLISDFFHRHFCISLTREIPLFCYIVEENQSEVFWIVYEKDNAKNCDVNGRVCIENA